MSLRSLIEQDERSSDRSLICRFLGWSRKSSPQHVGDYIELEDHTARMSLELLGSKDQLSALRPNSMVQVTLIPMFDDRPVAWIVETLMPAKNLTAGDVVRLLGRPVSNPLVKEAHRSLQDFAQSLANDPLGGFVARLFADPSIAVGFPSVPASWNHHHAYAGGLLVHSIEVLRLVGEMARLKLPHQPRRIWQCQVAALLHDLGKVVTHGQKQGHHRPELSHEFLSVRLASRHLDWLATVDLESADELSASLQYGSRTSASRQRGQSVVAELVALADQCSAMHLGEWNRRALYARPASNDSSPSLVEKAGLK